MKKYLLAILFCLVSLGAQAKIIQGKDYRVLTSHHVTHTKSVEVLEFFSYTCAHCFQMSLKIDAVKWPSYVKLRRIQVMWGAPFEELMRLLATMEKIGKTSILHHRVFKAVLEQGIMLYQKDILFGWIKKQPDINFKEFLGYYNSPAVIALSNYYAQQTKAYAIDTLPTIIVGGKYLVLNSSHTHMVAVTRELIAKALTKK